MRVEIRRHAPISRYDRVARRCAATALAEHPQRKVWPRSTRASRDAAVAPPPAPAGEEAFAGTGTGGYEADEGLTPAQIRKREKRLAQKAKKDAAKRAEGGEDLAGGEAPTGGEPAAADEEATATAAAAVAAAAMARALRRSPV